MTPTTTSTCPRCAGAVLPDDRFCGSCGTAITGALPGAAPQATLASAPLSAPGAGTVADTSPWGEVAARLQYATLGEFEIMTELGRGGMAAVYLARDLALNRRVAIKVMAPGLLHGPGMIERFRQEAVTVANLQHAHIVSIHAVRQLEDLHFFVMQFVPGRTLEGVLRDDGALPIPVVRAWLYQVGSALGYAHRRGVIHRDVKPGNILLNADGDAIVTDFGIAKVAESPSHTQTGTVVGTPVYMSPEQCYARELTGASDQYSLGVVAYEMLAGRPPFAGSSFALMRAHTDEPPPPLRDARPDVPPALEAGLIRMLAKRSEDRFATLAEAMAALGATALGSEDAISAELQRLAAVSHRLELLADVIRTPASPVPKTRERPRAAMSTPPTTPATQALIVVVAPPASDLAPGASAVMRAVIKNAAGHPVSDADLRWTSSEPAIVSVDPTTGSIRALAAGTAVVTASVGVVQDSVDVTVTAPTAAPMVAGAARDQAATRNAGARIARVPNAGAGTSGSAAWRWAIPLAGAAAVAAYFVVQPTMQTGDTPGSGMTLRADSTAGRPAESTAPVVTASDTTASDTTSPTSSDSSTISGTANPATPIAESVLPAPPAAVPSRIEVSPASVAAIAPGQTIVLRATVRDAGGAVISNIPVTWSSSDTRVATIDASRGQVRGVGAGATRVAARAGSLTSALMVSVVPPTADPTTITSIQIPDVRALTVGESIRLTADVRTAGGVAANVVVDWASSNPSIASISQDGTVSARAAGSTTVHASAGGRSADRAVTVRPREVAVAPASQPTVRSEADLRSEIEVLLAAYARAIETRDTSLIRRVFPNAGGELMTRWQTTFNDARSNIQMSAGTLEILDTPRDVTGSQVQARASFAARFASKAARKDQSFPVMFTAVLQRDGGIWRITSIR